MAQDRLDIIVSLTDQATAGLNRIKDNVQTMSGRVDQFGKKFGLMGAAIVGATGLIAKAAFTQAAAFEQSTVAFETMLGSAEKGQTLLRQISDFAAKTPFTLPGVEESTRMLLAMGIESENIIPTLKSLGDVSAGLSVPLENIALAYGQVRAANQLYGTELRQFVNNGVPLLAVLAEQFGTTEASVKQMVENGEVGFKDVEKAFQSMSGEGGTFFNLMEKQSKTFNGQVSNLKDNLSLLAREFAPLVKVATGALAKVNDALSGLTNRIREVGLKQFFEENKTAIIVFAGVVGGLLLGAIVAVTAAFISFMGPALLIGAYVAAAGAAIGLLVAGFIKALPLIQAVGGTIRDFVVSAFSTLQEKVRQVAQDIQATFNAIKAFFEQVWEGIKNVFIFTLAVISGSVIDYFDKMGIDIFAVFEAISQFFSAWWDYIAVFFGTKLAEVKMTWEAFWGAISAFFTTAWAGISGKAKEAWGQLKTLFDSASAPIRTAWSGLWDGIKNTMSSAWEVIKGGVKAGINYIIDKINTFIKKVNEIAMKASRIPGIKADAIPQLPTIPLLANGGIITKPTLAMIGEGGESEAVVPLSKAGQMGFGGSAPVININISDTVLTRQDQVVELIGDPLMKVLKQHFAVV